MARLAGCGKARRGVIWVSRSLVISLVTAIAIGVGTENAVIKERPGKGRGGMAIATGVGKIHRHVIRRFLKIRRMAGIAVHRGPAKVFGIRSGMALDAENRRMDTR
jgi:hypothetical protein